MSKHQKTSIFLIILGLLAFTSVASAEQPYKVAFSPANLYLGHISYVEIKNDGQDPMILREGQSVPEMAVLNAPIGPGDVIRTSAIRRCEIQFDTATIIRLDTDTELRIETVLAQTLSASDRATNLVLAKGQLYIMYKEFDFRELFQVMTPAAAIKFSQDTVALVKAATDGATELQVKRGKATALFGPSAAQAKGRGVGKLESLIVSKDGLVQKAAYAADTDFGRWNEEINAAFNDLHKGLSFLPKPVQRFSPAIVAWAEKYSSRYGRWIYDMLYGYVWRPDNNDVYPWVNWRPYFYGHWTRAYDQLFWVSDEQWGWAPYHLGVWVWDKELGWIWIPGSVFASAWVGWGFFNGYYSWWPYEFSDWWMWNAWGSNYYDNYQSWYVYSTTPGKTLRKISKAQLKKPEPPLPLPNDLKAVYDRFAAALKKQDPRLIASLQQSVKRIVFAYPADIHFPNIAERAIPLSQLSSASELLKAQPSPADKIRHENPRAAAAWDWKKNIQLAAAKEPSQRAIEPINKIESFPASAAAPNIQAPSIRFLDWNPDLKTVTRFGGTIRYSSRTNEVQCPELGLTSRLVSVIGLPFRSAVVIDAFMGGASQGSSAFSSSLTGSSPVSSGGQSIGNSAGSSSTGSGSNSSGSQGRTKKD
ncbi:MAG: DUF6600 domain-containing protein [Candidatus Aminicenantales bacterium]